MVGDPGEVHTDWVSGGSQLGSVTRRGTAAMQNILSDGGQKPQHCNVCTLHFKGRARKGNVFVFKKETEERECKCHRVPPSCERGASSSSMVNTSFFF